MPINIKAIFFQPTVSKALPEYILEQSPPKIYVIVKYQDNPDTSPAIVADEPSAVAYSVTVDINAYITSAEKSRAPNTKKKSFVNILSSLTPTFIN